MSKRLRWAGGFLIVTLFFIPAAHASLLFFDDFNNGAKVEWGNERGNWFADGGVYHTESPNNSPMTISTVTTLTDLTDFIVDVDIQKLMDGGVWVRFSNDGDKVKRGMCLVTGGVGGTNDGLYWTAFDGITVLGSSPAVDHLGIRGSDNTHITIKVIGNTYEAFVNGSATPASTFIDDNFTSGKVGLYNFSYQTFDNFSVSDFNTRVVPEPTILAMLSIGVLGLSRRWIKR